ncbi:MAG: hypothetical protein ABIS47_07560 [Acidimicrobiales bacterium]
MSVSLRVFFTVFEIALVVLTLAFFLNRISIQLVHITKTLAKVTFGVRAVETQCAVIGPAADRINANLAEAAGGLEKAAVLAERLAR